MAPFCNTGLKLRLVIVFVLTVALTFLAAVLAVVWSMPDIPEVYSTNLCLKFAHRGDIDLTCTENSLHTFAQKKVTAYYEKNVDAYTHDKTDELQGTDIISLKAYIHNNDENIKPVARLTGSYGVNPEQEKEDEKIQQSKTGSIENKLIPVRKWTSLRDMRATGGIRRFGVQIKNGRIVVPVAGEYELYSFIHFREPCVDGVPQVDNPNIPIQQSIFKFDILAGRDEELISCSQPHKISQNDYVNMYGSFLSSVVRLKAGDELSVKVPNITQLRVSSFNYFGAHLL